MTVPTDAFDIASRFLDSGAKRNELEVAILQHMEHHIAVEREVCARIAEATAGTSEIDIQSGIARAIRMREKNRQTILDAQLRSQR